jgi:hypothetical protein
MRVTVMRPVEVDVRTARLVLPLRYPGEVRPENAPDFPGRVEPAHGRWAALEYTIDVDTGRIRDWPQGREAKLHLKVCDEGSYFLYDAAGDPVYTLAGDYVPGWVPGEWGDYVELDIDAAGVITNWRADAVRAFLESDDDV